MFNKYYQIDSWLAMVNRQKYPFEYVYLCDGINEACLIIGLN